MDQLGATSITVMLNDSVSDLMTDATDIRFPFYLRLFATIACVLLLAIGCPGNILIPYVVIRTRELRNSTNIFLINLSISDLLILLISTPTVLIELHSQPEVWFLGLFMCKAVSFVEIFVAHVSILTMLAISFERYYAICRPLQSMYKCTKRRAIVIIALIWVVALVSTLPMLSITELNDAEYIDGSIVPVCSNTLQIGWHPIYFLSIFVLFFVLPFLVLLVLYVLISVRLTSDSKERVTCTSNSSRRAIQVRRQVVLMLASVCITFFVCLLPFRLMTLWIIASTREEIEHLGMEPYYSLLFVFRLLLFVNSSINPILYNVISSKFRNAFQRILHLTCGSPSPTSFSGSDGNTYTVDRFHSFAVTNNTINHNNNHLPLNGIHSHSMNGKVHPPPPSYHHHHHQHKQEVTVIGSSGDRTSGDAHVDPSILVDAV